MVNNTWKIVTIILIIVIIILSVILISQYSESKETYKFGYVEIDKKPYDDLIAQNPDVPFKICRFSDGRCIIIKGE